ncbi:LexA family transcriptional repressor [Martelella alba]|uniref:LexA family transcriptional repressor n=1 Tax=Martelella alba TaxID=2590451 RepID=A0ABY2SDF5_9HYPH|nr:LexA family transcriptional repressor [Martelella alba]
MTENRRKRLAEWFKGNPLPPKEKSYLSQLMTGRASFGERAARRLERTYGMPGGYLDISITGKFDNNVKFVAPYVPGKKYPVLSTVQAGAWHEAIEAYTLKDIDLWLESNAHIEGDGFWLKVEGDSMTAPTGLSIPEGTYVLFDTGKEPKNGSLVIAKLTDDNEATFKRLVIDGGQRYLKGLNPMWPLLPINGNCTIIGVGVETKMMLP